VERGSSVSLSLQLVRANALARFMDKNINIFFIIA
jgi:hypothetical protein